MDYSIEALIAEGTGLKTRDEMRYTSSSESAYDGYFDAVQAELTRSFENLEFLDTYSRVNEANDASKLRMMKRLKRVYGTTIDDPIKASSVESFIDRNIRSIEEDKKAEDSAQKTDGDTKKTDGSTKEPGKVKAFFQRIIEALKRMLEGLKNFFKGIWKKIKEFFSKKTKENSEVKTPEEIVDTDTDTDTFNSTYKPIDREKTSTNYSRNNAKGNVTIFDSTGFSIANAKKFFASKLDTNFLKAAAKSSNAGIAVDRLKDVHATHKSEYSIAYEIASKKSDQVGRRNFIASKMFNINKYFSSTNKSEIDKWYRANTIDKLFNVIDGLSYLESPANAFLKNIEMLIKKLEQLSDSNDDVGIKNTFQKNAEFLKTVSYAGNEIVSTALFLIKSVNSVLKPKTVNKTGKSALSKAEKTAIMKKNYSAA